jgi:hypothetical protein
MLVRAIKFPKIFTGLHQRTAVKRVRIWRFNGRKQYGESLEEWKEMREDWKKWEDMRTGERVNEINTS